MSTDKYPLRLSEEGLEMMKKDHIANMEDQTPANGNLCKATGCEGRVVSRVLSYFRGTYQYRPPACEKCGRRYSMAKDVEKVGVEEFEKKMNMPFTL